MTNVRPVIVFGISGATWDVIDPLLGAGRLPTLRGLIEAGSRATLASTLADGDDHYRPQVAWPTLATGVSPQHHGVTRFFHTLDDLRAPAVWDIYSECGLRVGLYGWPVTWPPPTIDGYLIPSHLARDARTSPPELAWIRELEDRSRLRERGERTGLVSIAVRLPLELLRLGVGPSAFGRVACALSPALMSGRREQRALALRHAKLELNAAVFAALYRKTAPHFAAFVTFLVDFASHRYWLYASSPDAPRPLRDAVADAYARCDRALGRLLAQVPRNAIVAVLSEHGMSVEREPAEIGEWRFVIRPERLRAFVGADPRLSAQPIARWVSYRTVDGQPPPDGTAERFRNVLAAENGRPLFDVFEHGDEIVVKLALDRAVPPGRTEDLGGLPIQTEGRTVPFAQIAQRFGRRRSAIHAREGMLVLGGPSLARARQLPEVDLVDVLPTLLCAAGLPRPAQFEGRVLDVFL